MPFSNQNQFTDLDVPGSYVTCLCCFQGIRVSSFEHAGEPLKRPRELVQSNWPKKPQTLPQGTSGLDCYWRKVANMSSMLAGTLLSKRPPEEKLRKRQQQIGEPWKRLRPAGKLLKKQRDWPTRLVRGVSPFVSTNRVYEI
jgi:hypothetical protein